MCIYRGENRPQGFVPVDVSAELVGDVNGGVLLGIMPLVLHHDKRRHPAARLAARPRRGRKVLHALEEGLSRGAEVGWIGTRCAGEQSQT